MYSVSVQKDIDYTAEKSAALLPPALDLEVGLTYDMLQFLRLGLDDIASEETELTQIVTAVFEKVARVEAFDDAHCLVHPIGSAQ